MCARSTRSWRTARSTSSALLPDNLGADVPRGIADLIQRLRALGAAEAEEIAARFPTQLRRVGGYNIDVLTPVGARLPAQENLARLLVGSEGTLAFSAAIELALHADQAAQAARHLPVPDLPHARWRPRSTSCSSIPRRWNWSIAP